MATLTCACGCGHPIHRGMIVWQIPGGGLYVQRCVTRRLLTEEHVAALTAASADLSVLAGTTKSNDSIKEPPVTSRRRVFVDVETAGLRSTQVTEAAWIDIDTGVYGLFIPPHSLEDADPEALRISRYWERIANQPVDDGTQTRRMFDALGGDGLTTTFIAANPSFDCEKVDALFARACLTPSDPWHHRKIDISQMAYDLFPDEFPDDAVLPGLKQVCTLLHVPLAAHHSALTDTVAGANCYLRLEAVRHSPLPREDALAFVRTLPGPTLPTVQAA